MFKIDRKNHKWHDHLSYNNFESYVIPIQPQVFYMTMHPGVGLPNQTKPIPLVSPWAFIVVFVCFFSFFCVEVEDEMFVFSPVTTSTKIKLWKRLSRWTLAFCVEGKDEMFVFSTVTTITKINLWKRLSRWTLATKGTDVCYSTTKRSGNCSSRHWLLLNNLCCVSLSYLCTSVFRSSNFNINLSLCKKA